MNTKTILNPSFLILIGIGVVLFWIFRRGVGGVASDVANGAVQAAGGLVEGAVYGVGSIVGVPRTAATQCEADQASGRTWDSSFSCPAGGFLKGLFGLSLPAKTNPKNVLGTRVNNLAINSQRMAAMSNNRPSDGHTPSSWLRGLYDNARHVVGR